MRALETHQFEALRSATRELNQSTTHGDNAALMGARISARNEVGPSRSHIQPDAGTPETPTEVQPNVVKPAA